MHQGRLAGAVVSDQAETFTPFDAKIDTTERTDGAEMLFDAVQFDDSWARNDHCPYTWRQRAVIRFGEATTSCWL